MYLMATTYHRRPSEIVGIADEWAAYQFDVAVMWAGLEERRAGGQHRPPDLRMADGDWAALAQL